MGQEAKHDRLYRVVSNAVKRLLQKSTVAFFIQNFTHGTIGTYGREILKIKQTPVQQGGVLLEEHTPQYSEALMIFDDFPDALHEKVYQFINRDCCKAEAKPSSTVFRKSYTVRSE